MLAERKSSKLGGLLTWVVLAVVLGAGLAGYIFYKYRLRVSLVLFIYYVCPLLSGQNVMLVSVFICLQSYMDSEIMAIMSQYMPLDSQQNQQQVVHHEAHPLTRTSSSV